MACGITPERIGQLIAEAPSWAKSGLTTSDERLRSDAIVTLGHHVYHSLFRPIDVDKAQMTLPL